MVYSLTIHEAVLKKLSVGSMWGRCRVDEGSMWGRCVVDEGSMWGRCGVDVGSLGGRCICGWKIYRINEEVEVEEVNEKMRREIKLKRERGE